MGKFVVFTIVSIFCSITYLYSQDCPNINFSENNFNNWSGFTGVYTNPGASPGIVSGQHTIITTQGFDPYTCGGLTMIPPGGTTSAQLGNNITGAQGERLTYTLSVDASNALFIYKYAVVLEDAGHSSLEQPKFSVRVLDQSGNQVGGFCGFYEVYGGQPGQNFQVCGGVTWLPWTTVGIDLQQYIGQNVTIEFSTIDCSQGGHFGYAYISAECQPLIIDVDFCVGSNNVTLDAPVGFQSYVWSTGDTTRTISISNPIIGSNYSCMLTSFSNQGSCTVTVGTQISPSQINAGFSTASLCTGLSVQFSDTTVVTGSDFINNWFWDFGDGSFDSIMNPTHSYTTSGSYNVQLVVVSDDGCMDTVVNQISNSLNQVSFYTSNVCLNDTAVFVNTTNTLQTTNFQWNFGDGTPTDTSFSPSHVYASPGIYNVTLIGGLQNQCADSTSFTIEIYSPPNVEAGTDLQICPNTFVTFSGSGASTYSWNNGVIDNMPFSVNSSQQYVVQGIDSLGCISSDTVTIVVLSPQVASFTSNAVCEGAVSTLMSTSGSGLLSHEWQISGLTVSTDSVYNIIYPSNGNHPVSLIITDANGCKDTVVQNVVVYENPIANFSATTACLNDANQLSSSSFSTGAIHSEEWYSNDTLVGTGTIISLNSSSSGTFTIELQVTDNNGCIDSIEQTIQIFDLPQAVISTQNICIGAFAEFESISSSQAGISSEIWTLNNSTFATGSMVDTILTNTGVYGVELIVIDANGCSDTAQSSIEVYQSPIASFTSNAVCEGAVSTLMSTSGSGLLSHEWQISGLTVSTDSVYNTIYPSNGNHPVSLIITDANGCKDSVVQNVVVYENPTANFLWNTVCLNDSSNFISTSTSNSGIQMYEWYIGNTLVGNFQNHSEILPSHGNHTIQLVIIDDNGCQDSITNTVFVYSRPVVSFSLSMDEGCSPLCVEFEENVLDSSGADFSLNWLENGLSIGTNSNFIKCYQNTSDTAISNQISLVATNQFGCVATSLVLDSILIHPTPIAEFNFNQQAFNILDEFITVSNSSLFNNTNQWYFDNNFISDDIEPFVDVPDYPGVFDLTLIVTSDFGCIDSVSKQILIKDEIVFYVPNTFTPNGDGFNNIFKPVITSGIDESNYQLIIFDRWGEIVFESKEVNEGWDGTYKGNMVQDGTYVWKLILKSIENDLKEEHVGHVNILK